MMNDDDYKVYYISHPNTKIGGHIELDENGFASIFINSRRSYDQQLRTFEHELRHLENDDLNNDDKIEVAEARASGKNIDVPEEKPKPITKTRPKIQYLELSDTLLLEAKELFGLSETDKRWNEIWWAMLITGMPDQPGRPSRVDKKRIYYYPPVKIRRGKMYKAPKVLPPIDRLEQRYALRMPEYFVFSSRANGG